MKCSIFLLRRSVCERRNNLTFSLDAAEITILTTPNPYFIFERLPPPPLPPSVHATALRHLHFNKIVHDNQAPGSSRADMPNISPVVAHSIDDEHLLGTIKFYGRLGF